MLSLLTMVAGSTNSEHMLNAAVVLQSGLGAELVVVYASPIAEIPTVVGDAFGYVPMINPEDIDRYRKNARAAFDKLCGSNPRSHFKDTNASIAYSLRKFAMFADLGVLTKQLNQEPLAWATSRGDTTLLDQVNGALAAMEKDGTQAAILNTWVPFWRQLR